MAIQTVIPLKEVFLLNKLFLLQKMSDLLEKMQKDSKVQNEISQTIEKCIKESYATQSKIGQKTLVQSNVFKHSINIMGDTNEDKNLEKKQKYNKIILQKIK